VEPGKDIEEEILMYHEQKDMTLVPSEIKITLAKSMSIVLLLAGLFALLFFRLPLRSDSYSYYRMSLNFLRGEPSDFYWPLGWPAMMTIAEWIAGESQTAVKGFSFLLVLITLWLQLFIVQKGLPISTSVKRQWFGYGIVLINAPHLLYHANFTLTVVPMAFWGTLLTYTLLFTQSVFSQAALISFMTAVRFGSIFLLPFVLVFKRLRGSSYKTLIGTTALVLFFVAIPVTFVSLSLGRFTLLNTANSKNLFYGNHPLAPIYETWQWGSSDTPQKRLALEELKRKYLRLANAPPLPETMQREALKSIVNHPGLFSIRCFTRLSVLLGFDTSVGSDSIQNGHKITGVFLLGLMLIISVVTKFAAVIALIGTKWPGRHLIWCLLGGLSFPHIIAFAHPSYFQMFMNVVVPVVAVSVARVDTNLLKSALPFISSLFLIILCCHCFLIYHMYITRF
jgi:hypothetical protein